MTWNLLSLRGCCLTVWPPSNSAALPTGQTGPPSRNTPGRLLSATESVTLVTDSSLVLDGFLNVWYQSATSLAGLTYWNINYTPVLLIWAPLCSASLFFVALSLVCVLRRLTGVNHSRCIYDCIPWTVEFNITQLHGGCGGAHKNKCLQRSCNAVGCQKKLHFLSF